MTAEEVLDGLFSDERCDILQAMEIYAKYQSELAFDAGMQLAAFYETNHPANALSKEEYINTKFK